MNTLEQLVAFLPAMWIYALVRQPALAAIALARLDRRPHHLCGRLLPRTRTSAARIRDHVRSPSARCGSARPEAWYARCCPSERGPSADPPPAHGTICTFSPHPLPSLPSPPARHVAHERTPRRFAAVRRRTRAARSDPGRHRGLRGRHQSAQGQSRRRRLLRRHRQAAAARMREACRARDDRPGNARAAICRSTASPPTTGRSSALLFGADSDVIRSGRAVTVQALGGTGGLKIGADFLRRFAPGAQVWISDPSWENHRALFEERRLHGQHLPLLRRGDARPRLRGDARARSSGCRRLDRRAARVLPQPDGRRSYARAVDAHHRSRARARSAAVPRHRVPGLRRRHRRGRARSSAASPPRQGPLFVSSSFSKSFSLYGERVGALSVVAADQDEAARVLSQLKRVVRANYSTPPTHGGQIVTHGARLAGTARAVGSRARDDARPHQADARHAGGAAARARARTPTSASCSRSVACSRTRA